MQYKQTRMFDATFVYGPHTFVWISPVDNSVMTGKLRNISWFAPMHVSVYLATKDFNTFSVPPMTSVEFTDYPIDRVIIRAVPDFGHAVFDGGFILNRSQEGDSQQVLVNANCIYRPVDISELTGYIVRAEIPRDGNYEYTLPDGVEVAWLDLQSVYSTDFLGGIYRNNTWYQTDNGYWTEQARINASWKPKSPLEIQTSVTDDPVKYRYTVSSGRIVCTAYCAPFDNTVLDDSRFETFVKSSKKAERQKTKKEPVV